MHDIGFHLNFAQKDGRARRVTPSVLNRVALVDAHLRDAGLRVFTYSPGAIRVNRRTVAGLRFENGGFVEAKAEIPRVNGNWSNRTRRLLERTMGYHEFGRWAMENGIGIYVPHSFSELIGNKLETYKLVRGFHETLHPHCEAFTHSAKQIEHFLDTGDLVFVKPRSGSKGNRIVTLRRTPRGVTVTRYHKGRRRAYEATGPKGVLAIVREATRGRRKYVIQHGVQTLRHEGSTFDIRVTMLNDGRKWHCLHEARLSPSGSDVSNVSQGGTITPTENLLFDVVGPDAGSELLYQLQSESFGLASYLETLHPGEIHEIAFDFAVDTEGVLRLLEVNTKPGLAGIGSNVSVFEKGPEHEEAFERWVHPHARYLADFFVAKAREKGIGRG